ncbi:carbohydrate ABC transporter permease [Haloferax marisrubri]|uniref:Carbohydrate ABC transporter permease n=1 Tax=Haloferax marisrubri TaxID=1544719 RepID=A0A2P4NM39_9EURY|nr:carbohydrate ABC transporter permease [Haloferax marisrubri]POG54161.1 carbohydrate ABC transporter permease [Haloferax marisrubri]
MSAIEASESALMRRARYVLIAVMTVVITFPILWIFLSSIKQPDALFTSPPQVFPREVTLEHYRSIITDSLLLRYLFNSIVVASLTTLVSLLLAVFAGYGWGKFDFYGARTTSVFVLVSQMFPVVVLIIPLFELLSRFSMLNSYQGLVFAYLVYTVPLSTWMLKGFFEGIPENVLRAARIDGLSELRVFTEIALPLVVPGIAATAIYAFIMAWQEFFFALTFMQEDSLKTLPVGLLGFVGQYDVSWGALMAASFVTVLPVTALFLFLQRYFIQGIASGAVKG